MVLLAFYDILQPYKTKLLKKFATMAARAFLYEQLPYFLVQKHPFFD
jgi:hypothetical protein